MMRDKHPGEGGYIFADCASAAALERTERMDSVDPAAGPPLICSVHVQGLGRGYGVVSPKAIPPKAVTVVTPISELDLKIVIPSKVTPTPPPPPPSLPPSGTLAPSLPHPQF
jgi:hypothetical protein